jgi:hypothetical protein
MKSLATSSLSFVTLFVASIPLLDSFSASKDACVASDSQSFQVALDEVGPGFLPVSYQRVTSPVPSSSGADSFSLMVLFVLLV